MTSYHEMTEHLSSLLGKHIGNMFTELPKLERPDKASEICDYLFNHYWDCRDGDNPHVPRHSMYVLYALYESTCKAWGITPKSQDGECKEDAA